MHSKKKYIFKTGYFEYQFIEYKILRWDPVVTQLISI